MEGKERCSLENVFLTSFPKPVPDLESASEHSTPSSPPPTLREKL